MLKMLNNENKKLYQWDVEQRVYCDNPNVTEVHFSNKAADALVVECKDGIADIPNIILQQPFDLYVYASDGVITLESLFIPVIARTKPADYVYTETELKSYEALEKRIEKVEDIDLSVYATKEDLENVSVDLTGYATETYVNEKIEAIPEPDLSGYALKTELPDVSAFQTAEQVQTIVDEAIAAIPVYNGEEEDV